MIYFNNFVGKRSLSFLTLSLISALSLAASYPLPESSESLIGQLQYSKAASGDTVVNIAKKYDVGYNAMEGANASINMARGFLNGMPLTIPTQHLLPSQPREGIVINLPEMRMYYFPKGSHQVLTYPIGIGKVGKTIPVTQTSITRKTKNPIWIPTPDIHEFNLQQGIVLPKVMQPGPDNPLGPFAIYMRLPTYLIHSTIFPESIGKRASFGCIRMYESDIQHFFPIITPGTPVSIINSPVKVAWQKNHVFMEAHQPLEEGSKVTLPSVVHLFAEISKNKKILMDWQLITYLSKKQDGIPHEVGMQID